MQVWFLDSIRGRSCLKSGMKTVELFPSGNILKLSRLDAFWSVLGVRWNGNNMQLHYFQTGETLSERAHLLDVDCCPKGIKSCVVFKAGNPLHLHAVDHVNGGVARRCNGSANCQGLLQK